MVSLLIYGTTNYSYLHGIYPWPFRVSDVPLLVNLTLTWSEKTVNKSIMLSFFTINTSGISVQCWSSRPSSYQPGQSQTLYEIMPIPCHCFPPQCLLCLAPSPLLSLSTSTLLFPLLLNLWTSLVCFTFFQSWGSSPGFITSLVTDTRCFCPFEDAFVWDFLVDLAWFAVGCLHWVLVVLGLAM